MAKRRDKQGGPQFVQYFGPVIDALKDLGGSGRPTEVKDLIAAKLNISEEEQNIQVESGGSRFSKNVDWARFYLAKTGYIGSSERGVWSLTEKGYSASLTQQTAMVIFQEVQSTFRKSNDIPEKVLASQPEDHSIEQVEALEAVDYRDHYRARLGELSAKGFERFCQRLLRESGFQDLEVTGRSHDGGIDGHGVLQINPFVSFQVYFQCKKYIGTVSASVVRDFRGAMSSRADKGIILTTGSFTREARKEATRDGAIPIELVDGDKLMEMVELLKLGVTPKTVFTVDDSFFEEFKEH